MESRVVALFRSPTVEILDWRCAGHAEPFGGEESTELHEVVVVRRGAYVRRAEGQDVFVDSGTVAFAHPGECYRVRHPVAGGDACSAFRLSRQAAAELVAVSDRAAPDAPVARFPTASAPLDGRTFLLHTHAVHAASDPMATPLEVEERAVRFLRAVVEAAAVAQGRDRAGPAGRSRRAAEYAARVREVVARRYRERLALADLAREVGCSRFHLSRVVTAVAGVPIHRLVLRLRLRDALERLLETREGVSAIAYATGFASHSHLTDAFRREYGCPPSAVRRLAAREVRQLRGQAQQSGSRGGTAGISVCT